MNIDPVEEKQMELIAAKAQRERSTSNLLDHLASLVNVAVIAIKKEYKLIVVVCMFACLPVFAMGQNQPATPVLHKHDEIPSICDVKEPDCKDKLKLENLDLKIGRIVDEFNAQAQKQFEQMVKPQMQPLQDERAKLVAKLNAAHPGFVWHDPSSPSDTYQGFKAVPAPPAPATAPKPVDKAVPVK